MKRLLIPVLSAVLSSGCLGVHTTKTEKEKEIASASGAAYEIHNASNSEYHRVSLRDPNFKIESQGDARSALVAAREELGKDSGYYARKGMWQIAGFNDPNPNRRVNVKGFYEEDLKRVTDGESLQIWNSGTKGLDNTLSFLGFLEQVYGVWFESNPLGREKKMVFDNLVKVKTFRTIYEDCKKSGENPQEALRKKYLSVGTRIENALKSQRRINDFDERQESMLDGERATSRPVQIDNMSNLTARLTMPIGGETHLFPAYVPSNHKAYDSLEGKWSRGFDKRHPAHEMPKNVAFYYGNPVDGRAKALEVVRK